MVTLNKFIKELNMQVIYGPEGYENIEIKSNEINRPGMQFCGYYKKFKDGRIQIIGIQEWEYLKELSPEARTEALEKLFKRDFPAIIFSNNNFVFFEVTELAKKYGVTVLSTARNTTRLITDMILYMDIMFAPKVRVHGVLLDIYGVGVLITGESGVGKSETALELIERGHKLVSDDSVIVRNIGGALKGRSPEVTKYFMEIRGVGIVDVGRMFGIGSVMDERPIDLIVKLELWNEEKDYERLGIDDRTVKVLGQDVIEYNIPVRPGRNSALIIEAATKSYKQKMYGYNPGIELNERIMKQIATRKRGRQQ